MIAPPRTTVLLLEALGASAEFREPLLGDLAEEFAQRAEHDGVTSARRWYYREAMRATPHLLRGWVRGLAPRDVSRTIGILMTSYTLVVVAGMFTFAIMNSIRIAAGYSLTPLSFRQGFPYMLVIGFASTVAGGFFSASLDKKAPLVSAMLLGVVWSALSAASFVVDGNIPVWYRLTAPVLVLIGTATGGILRVRKPRPQQVA